MNSKGRGAKKPVIVSKVTYVLFKEYPSLEEASKELSIAESTISAHIKRGGNNLNGYKFEYKEK